jgi:CHASE2 domain-containing sensor protein/class 3 adenylate cyclase
VFQLPVQLRKVSASLTNLPTSVLAMLAIAAAGLSVTGVLMVLRQVGAIERLELAAYDHMVRLRPDEDISQRLLIVGISEKDIQTQKRFPLSDQTIAALLKRLQQHKPQVIGLDVYRDFAYEPGNEALAKELQQPNVITITKLPDPDDIGVPPPAKVPPERVGFNDIPKDPDNLVRRSLLFATAEHEYSFAMRVTLAYLAKFGIQPEQTDQGNLILGKVEFPPLETTTGQYQMLDAAGYQLLLDYSARRNLAPQISLTQVLRGDFNPAIVKDRIVLIGTTARSMKDVFATPYSAGDRETPTTPGVIIHGQVVRAILANVLDDKPLFKFWADWQEVAWISFWAIVGGGLAWLIRNPLLLGVVGTGTVVLLLVASYGLFLKHIWVPTAAPALGLGTTAILVVAYRAQQAHRQQQMTMKLLGQNTSPEIATALWQSRDRLLKSGKLPGQSLTATMLFTDIRNFSTIAEQMPPENLLEWLNEYLSVITQEVQVRQGIINKFTGDGMLAVFGVPVNRTEPLEVSQDAQQAVACALAMGDRLQELNQNWQKRGLPTIEMRVGVFTGTVVVGSLGGKTRLEYGVIGDSVNIAARLESYEKNRQTDLCRVLIAKDTLVHLQAKFDVEPWGALELKGKRQKVDVYRVIGWAAQTAEAIAKAHQAADDNIEPTKVL